ncbi:MAG: DUF4367 domain-containing protein [Methanosarcinales archaeon]|nr:DUF4367 domain-containing protein [Methanosarcinales archaeon]
MCANGECKCRRKKSVKRIWEEEGKLTDIFGNKLLKFSYGEINFMITGTISKEELIKIAE